MPAYPHNRAARLARLDREIMARVKEVSTLLRAGDELSLLYCSNLRTAGNPYDIVAAAIGDAGVIAGFLAMQEQTQPEILANLPLARQVIAASR